MVYKIKGFGYKRGLNDPRDFTPESDRIKGMEETGKYLFMEGGNGNAKKKATATPRVTPTTVDNRQWTTPVTNQGNLGSCTANMAASIYEYMERKAYGSAGKFIDGARLFIYKTTRFLMGKEGEGDSGAYIRTTFGAMRIFGVPPEQYWPYTDKDPDFDKEPTSLVTSMGKEWQSISYFRLDYSKNTDENIARIKEYVAKGFAIGFGFTVFSSYSQAAKNGGIFPFPSKNEKIEGGHAVTIVGYDDNKVSKNTIDGNEQKGCFLIQNSWGESWGEKGFGWIPYQYFRTGANGDVFADDVFAMTKVEWLSTGEFFF